MKITSLLLLLIVIISCKKENEITTYIDDSWKFVKPSHFPNPDYNFENKPQSQDKFELGRFLFYDPIYTILSIDSSISCASCHAQEHTFADHNIPLSQGVDGVFGLRNSPALSNLAWCPNFMWDGGINHIETFSIGPITNVLEMKESIPNVLIKLNKSEFYKSQFKKAFGVDNITDDLMLKSLAQFMAMIISDKSKYDDVLKGNSQFSSSEKTDMNCLNQIVLVVTLNL
jgi:cytochrome c peroxidase